MGKLRPKERTTCTWQTVSIQVTFCTITSTDLQLVKMVV